MPQAEHTASQRPVAPLRPMNARSLYQPLAGQGNYRRAQLHWTGR